MKSNIALIIGVFVTIFAPLVDFFGAINSTILIPDVYIFVINGILGAFGVSLGIGVVYTKRVKHSVKRKAYLAMVLNGVFGLVNFYLILRTIFLIFTLRGVF